MRDDKGKVAAEFIARLKEKGFFTQFCDMVCPDEKEGKCQSKEDCPYSRDEIMEFWYEAAKNDKDKD